MAMPPFSTFLANVNPEGGYGEVGESASKTV